MYIEDPPPLAPQHTCPVASSQLSTAVHLACAPPPPHTHTTHIHRDREEDEEEDQQQQLGPVGTLALGAVTHPGSKQQTAAGGTRAPANSGGISLSGRTGARPAASGMCRGMLLLTGTAVTGATDTSAFSTHSCHVGFVSESRPNTFKQLMSTPVSPIPLHSTPPPPPPPPPLPIPTGGVSHLTGTAVTGAGNACALPR
jgi:hypothetical protein